jgi:hypothetical protein
MPPVGIFETPTGAIRTTTGASVDVVVPVAVVVVVLVVVLVVVGGDVVLVLSDEGSGVTERRRY